MRLIAMLLSILTIMNLPRKGYAQPSCNVSRGNAGVAKPLIDKSIVTCAVFTQTDRADDGIAIVVANACGIPLTCSLKWTVVCAPDSAKRKVKHNSRLAFVVEDGKQEEHTASPAICKSDSWSIEGISWSCVPQ
jgi:hypothetical protein